ncbi:MAG: class II fumarate hydratase [Gammaproteobacteria bacterium]
MGNRTEKDSMGSLEVPENALYGAQTQRAVQNFPVSNLRMPRAFLKALGLIKAACAEANAKLNLLDQACSEAIVDAALQVANGEFDDQFPVDVFQTGSGTSSNMNANEVIAQVASEKINQKVHPNDHVNMSQSSNDVIPTAIHVSAALSLREKLLPALKHLQNILYQREVEFQNLPKTGRTHLMDAMPLTLGQEISAWIQQLADCQTRLENTMPRITAVALGGTAVGTGINAHPEFAKLAIEILGDSAGLGFSPAKNYFNALSCQDTAVEVSGQLKTLAVALMKIANDLRWMNSGPLSGLGEIALPAIQPGSSIMPGKVNPVIPESVAMVCAQVIGNDTTITIAGQSGNFQLNVMLPLITYNLLQSIELLANASKLLADKAIAGFTVNENSIALKLACNPILVTALNPVIGYELGAQIAKRAYLENRPLRDVAEEMTDLSADDLDRLLDPYELTRGGIKG